MLTAKHSYQKQFQTVAENAPDVICRFDKKLYHLYVNPAIEKVTGVPQVAFIGKRPHDLPLPPKVKRAWIKHLEFVFETSEQTTFEFPFPSPTQTRIFQSMLVPEFNSKGEIDTVLSISRDITQIRDREKEQHELVGIVSHELKSPVTSLKALTQIMERQFSLKGDVKTVDRFKKMSSQLNKLTHLIGDLLETTKIESKTLQLNKEVFDFTELVFEIVDTLQATTSQKIKIINGHSLHLFGDKNRIGQVLVNLLSNAIKYSPKNSKILVKYKANKKSLTCSVQDFGIGIAKKRQKHIFERFYRVEPKDEKIFPGLGLGLYIASELIRAHGGTISVKSTEGKGSIFSFILPLQTS